MCQGVKISVDKGDDVQKVKGSHEVAPKQPESQPESMKAARINPLVIQPQGRSAATASKTSSGGLSVPGFG